jgi:hypothetical protein
VQPKRRGFWRLLIVREARHLTAFPPTGADAVDDQGNDPAPPPATLASIDMARFTTPVDAAAASASINGSGSAPAGAPVWVVPPAAAAGIDAFAESDAAEMPPADEVALMLQVSPIFASAEAAQAELRRFATYLHECCAAASLPLPAAVLVQDNALAGNGASADARIAPLPGWPCADRDGTSGTEAAEPPCIHDTLGELRFPIHPAAFFQVRCSVCSFVPWRLCAFRRGAFRSRDYSPPVWRVHTFGLTHRQEVRGM